MLLSCQEVPVFSDSDPHIPSLSLCHMRTCAATKRKHLLPFVLQEAAVQWQVRSATPLQGKAQKTALSSRTLGSQQDSSAICHSEMKSCCILATGTLAKGCSSQ